MADSITTRVEGSTDNTGGHPRYIPVTTSPPRANWLNEFRGSNCGSCHETTASPGNPPMPPVCARDGDQENCYRAP